MYFVWEGLIEAIFLEKNDYYDNFKILYSFER